MSDHDLTDDELDVRAEAEELRRDALEPDPATEPEDEPDDAPEWYWSNVDLERVRFPLMIATELKSSADGRIEVAIRLPWDMARGATWLLGVVVEHASISDGAIEPYVAIRRRVADPF